MGWIAYLEVDISLEGCQSLKDRRRVIKMLIGVVQHRFSISVADISSPGSFCAQISLACVGNERSYVHSRIEKVLFFLEERFPSLLLGERYDVVCADSLF